MFFARRAVDLRQEARSMRQSEISKEPGGIINRSGRKDAILEELR